jgi:hypothetical protein
MTRMLTRNTRMKTNALPVNFDPTKLARVAQVGAFDLVVTGPLSGRAARRRSARLHSLLEIARL